MTGSVLQGERVPVSEPWEVGPFNCTRSLLICPGPPHERGWGGGWRSSEQINERISAYRYKAVKCI